MIPQASTIAPYVDRLYDFIFWVSVLSFIGVIVAMLYFVVKYRRSRWDPYRTPYITGHSLMESSVSIILLVLVMLIFAWGWRDYRKMVHSPSDALEIGVIARQWFWEFEYDNGKKLTNELIVPKGQPVKLLMSSMDVIHSFFVPNFRLKQDVVPGTYTSLWFTATQTGDHPVFCAEYCGTNHSKMLAKVKVVEPDEYRRWYSEKPNDAVNMAQVNPQELGKELFNKKMCMTCHTATKDKLIGPGLAGIFGTEIELEGGKKVMVDENYIRESLMQPQAKLVKGFPPVMPTFQGTLTDAEINALIAFIKSLK